MVRSSFVSSGFGLSRSYCGSASLWSFGSCGWSSTGIMAAASSSSSAERTLRSQRWSSPLRGTVSSCSFSTGNPNNENDDHHQNKSTSSSSSSSSPIRLAHRLDGLDAPTVWHEFTPLSKQHQSINLGQGFPDWDPPRFVVEALQAAVTHRHANQYAPSQAHPALAQALVHEYTHHLWWNPTSSDNDNDQTPSPDAACFDLDPTQHVATTVGCTQALYCALQGLINAGDEVVLLEPAFDIYHSQVRMAGGTCVFVPLRPKQHMTPTASSNDQTKKTTLVDTPNEWHASDVFDLDLEEFQAALSDRTKVILLNTPHNPTGKVFSRAELQGMADILQQPEYQHIVVISDEVYEHIVFDPDTRPHVSMATIPGMFHRTLTLSSSGKTFSCTGWKVGWAIGPAHLVHAVTATNQWITFSAPTPTQDAMAQALRQARTEPYHGHATYFDYVAAEYRRKRTILQTALTNAGLTPIVPDGSFFVMADTSQVEIPESYLHHVTRAMPLRTLDQRRVAPRDWACCRWMTETVGVTAIPPSAFYSTPNVPLAQNLIRLAFCKTDETLQEAARRLEQHFGK